MADRKEYIERGALLEYLGADLEEDYFSYDEHRVLYWLHASSYLREKGRC